VSIPKYKQNTLYSAVSDSNSYIMSHAVNYTHSNLFYIFPGPLKLHERRSGHASTFVDP